MKGGKTNKPAEDEVMNNKLMKKLHMKQKQPSK